MLHFLMSRFETLRSLSQPSEAAARPHDPVSRIELRDNTDPDLASTDERRRAGMCEEMFYWGMAGGPGY